MPLGPYGSIQGMAVSPIYIAGNVVLLVDTPEEAWLMAFDAATGKQAWKVERPRADRGGGRGGTDRLPSQDRWASVVGARCNHKARRR
jgi:hypothetical protein